jgi:hypothetical protein
MAEDESYILGVLTGDHVTTGQWRQPRPQRSRHRGDRQRRPNQRRQYNSSAPRRRRAERQRSRSLPVELDDGSMSMLLDSGEGEGVNDPLCRCQEFQVFETMIKGEAMMVYGVDVLYHRVGDVFRPWELSKGLRQCHAALQRARGDDVFALNSPIQIIALSWLMVTCAVPSVVRLSLPEEDRPHSSGFLSSWMVAVIRLLHALKESRPYCDIVDRIEISMNALDFPVQCHHAVASQGFQHMFIALKELSEGVACKALTVSFLFSSLSDSIPGADGNIHPPNRDLMESWREFQRNVSEGIPVYTALSVGQKTAVLMGLHDRLGARSSLRLLNSDVIEYIFYITESMSRLCVTFSE